jgi:hypothetical protein
MPRCFPLQQRGGNGGSQINEAKKKKKNKQTKNKNKNKKTKNPAQNSSFC